jgi:hypothetical protein
MKEMALTGTEEGEKVSNFKRCGEGELIRSGRYGVSNGLCWSYAS